MARKKPEGEKPDSEKTVTAADVVGVTPERELKALLKKAKDTKRETSELSGTFGQAVANAVENKHLHRKAFNITKGLHQMADEKLAETMMHLEHYLEVSGINERVKKVGRLPLGDQADDGDGETERPGLQVHEGGRGRPVAEAAGTA